MKLFITGISGLLGLNIALQVRERYEVSGCYVTHPVALDGMRALKLDLTSPEETEIAVRRIQPDLVIHTAGLTSVETCEADPSLAYRLNVEATHHIAKAASDLGARLVHISTDHLFDGASPWTMEGDTPHPLNVYAETKLQAEEVACQLCPDALVIRTNFFGWGTSIRASFSDWVLKSLEQGRELTMFADVFFTPILINHLVELILRLVDHSAAGIFHVVGGERLSKYDFALKVAEVFGYPKDKIRAVSVEDFPFKAQRPKDMSLSSEKAESYLGLRMPDAEEGLKHLKSLEAEGRREALEEAIQRGVLLQPALRLKE